MIPGRRTFTDVADDWLACRDQRLPWFEERGERDLWRVSVPQSAPMLPLPEAPLVEWHGGERWVRADAGQARAIRDAAAAAGGHATLFRRGAAGDATITCFAPLAGPLGHIHRELKRQFDPVGIFNPGRLYADF